MIHDKIKQNNPCLAQFNITNRKADIVIKSTIHKTEKLKLPPSLPKFRVLSGSKITFIIMSEVIIDFATISRGCEVGSAEQLVNVMSVGL